MPQSFGCEQCWPSSAEAANDCTRSLVYAAVLVDESHFRVTVRRCATCAQPFVCVFTETIDWVDGDDPQARTVLPLTEEEASALVSGSPVGEGGLAALGVGRRSLVHDAPKGEPARSLWTTGIRMGRHD